MICSYRSFTWTVPGLRLPRRCSTPILHPRRPSHRLPHHLAHPMVATAAPVATGPSITTKTAIAVMAAATMARTTSAAAAMVALLARSPPHWFRRLDQCTVADLWPPVTGAHDYVPRTRVRWTAAFAGLRGHTGPLRVSRPPVRATAAAAVPASRLRPRMEPLARRQLGPVVAGQLFQLHGAPPASYLGPRLGGRLRYDAPHHSISW
jgi:hypothetical protein